MHDINYHHLQYFWIVAREGSIAQACQRLLLSQPTISGQLKRLEKSIGGKLFNRVGRSLVLTDLGQSVYRYADEIFSLGQELMDVLGDRRTVATLRLQVGVTDSMPKLIAYRLLAPALSLPEHVRLVCEDGPLDQLTTRLASHELDLVLTDTPAGGAFRSRVFHHLLGESGITFVATAPSARQHRKRFPASLNGVPFLLPAKATWLRRELETWLDAQGVKVDVRGEIDDSGLLKAFCAAGVGVAAVPTAIEQQVCQQYRVAILGRTGDVRQRFFVLSMERKLKHPAVIAIREAARDAIFEG